MVQLKNNPYKRRKSKAKKEQLNNEDKITEIIRGSRELTKDWLERGRRESASEKKDICSKSI